MYGGCVRNNIPGMRFSTAFVIDVLYRTVTGNRSRRSVFILKSSGFFFLRPTEDRLIGGVSNGRTDYTRVVFARCFTGIFDLRHKHERLLDKHLSSDIVYAYATSGDRVERFEIVPPPSHSLAKSTKCFRNCVRKICLSPLPTYGYRSVNRLSSLERVITAIDCRVQNNVFFKEKTFCAPLTRGP